ncbi:universal stress protein [Streptomyces sp. NPDC001594]|uniref:universal stress protein n=1 Tax=Streptomyces sp. NPDC001594 TaxID=3364590 RepID=UPI0036BCC299
MNTIKSGSHVASRGRVVVSVESAESGVAALRRGAAEARRRKADLVAVATWTPYGGELAELQMPCPEMCAALERKARDLLDTACRGAELEDVTVERRVVRGTPGKVLPSLAFGPDDVLVLVDRLGSAFWPAPRSLVRKCLHRSPVPVIVATKGRS